jgi:hypothetical protein
MTTNSSKLRGTRALQSAFSLIEVAVATAVVLVAFAGVFGVMALGFSISEVSRENLRATQIMTDKMEGVRLYSWTQLTNSSFLIPAFTNWFYETNNVGLSTASGYGVLYTGLVSVASVPFSNSYSSSMVQVSVTVGWNSSGSGWEPGTLAHSRSMTTYVSEQGMQNYIYNSN